MPEEALEPEPGAVLRRAPFSDNPRVGARGQRTQQRILDAALRVFGEAGYHQCSIDSITKLAGCSRVSFYQYFESKEDVFRHLALQVARQLNASTDLLDPLTPDLAGWETLRAWVGRYAEIYERYEPVFNAFPAAAESDATLIGDSVRTARRYLSGFRTRVAKTDLAPRELDDVIDLLRACLSRTLDDVSLLHTAAPNAFAHPVILDAYADVAHRTLFGLNPAVNAHRSRVRRPPKLPFGPVMRAAFDEDVDGAQETARGGPARVALLEAGREVFVTRGYHGTRVDDVVDAAGVSHGAFYRYFKNRDELAHLLAAQAMRTVSSAFLEIPDAAIDGAAGRAALRRWLRTYNQAQVNEAAMIRVWVDAALQDDSLLADSASVLDWGRRRMAHFLQPREFGDPETDAVVLLALVDAFGVRAASSRGVDAAASIIERGFLGR
ncbi:MAG TPA: TetR/AcrR family transcriptional regulator [Acidimicrobiales bacterium]|jgi:AcrR family transcriptional regulator|nr:TetR/AcrR family transcriptional regulator [Acidimicrobiales bacterium]